METETIEFKIPTGYVLDETASDKTRVVYKKIAEKITDRIKTLQDAILYLGENHKEVIDLRKMISAGISGHKLAYQKLVIIIEALNEHWIPDFDNSNEKKWYPYFNIASGFGFSVTVYIYDRTTTAVGSRLCFKSQEIAVYAAKQFLEIYKEYYI